MIYGHAKKRQMARSILPAKRTFAKMARRHKVRINQHYRRETRQLLHEICRDEEFEQAVIWPDPRPAKRATVLLRREGDKLEHFQRWAVKVSAHRPIDERLSYLRTVLPDGVIGMHAMLHLQYTEGLREICEHEPRYQFTPECSRERKEASRREAERRHTEVERQLYNLIGSGKLKLFNQRIKWLSLTPRLWPRETEDRSQPCLLLGQHDIERFMHYYGELLMYPEHYWSKRVVSCYWNGQVFYYPIDSSSKQRVMDLLRAA